MIRNEMYTTKELESEYLAELEKHNFTRRDRATEGRLANCVGVIDAFEGPNKTSKDDFLMTIIVKEPGMELNHMLMLFYSNLNKFPKNVKAGSTLIALQIKAYGSWKNKHKSYTNHQSKIFVYHENDYLFRDTVYNPIINVITRYYKLEDQIQIPTSGQFLNNTNTFNSGQKLRNNDATFSAHTNLSSGTVDRNQKNATTQQQRSAELVISTKPVLNEERVDHVENSLGTVYSTKPTRIHDISLKTNKATIVGQVVDVSRYTNESGTVIMRAKVTDYSLNKYNLDHTSEIQEPLLARPEYQPHQQKQQKQQQQQKQGQGQGQGQGHVDNFQPRCFFKDLQVDESIHISNYNKLTGCYEGLQTKVDETDSKKKDAKRGKSKTKKRSIRTEYLIDCEVIITPNSKGGRGNDYKSQEEMVQKIEKEILVLGQVVIMYLGRISINDTRNGIVYRVYISCNNNNSDMFGIRKVPPDSLMYHQIVRNQATFRDNYAVVGNIGGSHGRKSSYIVIGPRERLKYKLEIILELNENKLTRLNSQLVLDSCSHKNGKSKYSTLSHILSLTFSNRLFLVYGFISSISPRNCTDWVVLACPNCYNKHLQIDNDAHISTNQHCLFCDCSSSTDIYTNGTDVIGQNSPQCVFMIDMLVTISDGSHELPVHLSSPDAEEFFKVPTELRNDKSKLLEYIHSKTDLLEFFIENLIYNSNPTSSLFSDWCICSFSNSSPSSHNIPYYKLINTSLTF